MRTSYARRCTVCFGDRYDSGTGEESNMLIFNLSKMSRVVTFFLFLKVLVLAPGSSSLLQRDYYTKGREFLKVGDWEGVLKVRWEERAALEGKGETAPCIGVAFIELATEEGAERLQM
jgi:hypothetical protein